MSHTGFVEVGLVTASTIRSSAQVAALALILVLTPAAAQEAQESEVVEPEVTIEAILVEPEKPAADTLCRLSVRLHNHGDQVASQLGFSVRINGAEIPVYSNQLFMFPLQPGAVSELALFNFWSTETSRPMPKDGKLKLEITLREAQRTMIEMIEGVETWTPLGAVPGLPSTASLTLEMSR